MSNHTDTHSFPKLAKNNYNDWKFEMTAKLRSRNLWRLVSGQKKRPMSADKAEEAEKWDEDKEKAAGLIASALEKGQWVHVIGHEGDPVKMWELLERVHMQKEAGTRFNAYDALFNIKKEPSESLQALVNRATQALQLCQNLRPESYSLKTQDEELLIMTLIRALPEEYQHFTSALLLQKNITKESVISAFITEENNRVHQASTRAMNAVHHNAQPLPSPPATRWCDFCESNTHTTSACFALAKAKKSHLDQRQMQQKERRQKKKEKAQQAQPAQQAPSQLPLQTTPQPSQNNDEKVHMAHSAASVPYHCLPHFIADASHLWCADTGATAHMTCHHHWLYNYKPHRVAIELADNSVVYSAGIGSVVFNPIIHKKDSTPLWITDVLYVPQIKNNLISVLFLTSQKGLEVSIKGKCMSFRKGEEILFTATASNKLAYLDGHTQTNPQSCNTALIAASKSLDLELWHRRLGHLGIDGVKRLITKDLVTGMELTSDTPFPKICEPCIHGKQHRDPFPHKTSSRATKVLQLVHSDVHGPLKVQTAQGYRYWITFIDDKSRFASVWLLRTKDAAITAFKEFKAYAENQTGQQIKALRDDKGGEYSSHEFASLTALSGIFRQKTAPGTPQQNGVAERFNRTLEEGIIAMLHDAGLPPSFWGEAAGAFVEAHNCCPTSAVTDSTPFQSWHNKKPSIAHLQVFGATAYVHVQKEKRCHLESHTTKCIMVGYEKGTKAWRLWDPVRKRIIISRDVIFDESPHTQPTGTIPTTPINTHLTERAPEYARFDEEPDEPLHTPRYHPEPASIPPTPAPDSPTSTPAPVSTPEPVPNPPSPTGSVDPDPPPIPDPPTLRRSNRQRHPPQRYPRVLTEHNEPTEADASNEGVQQAEAMGTFDHQHPFRELNQLSKAEHLSDPASYREAMSRVDAHYWEEACLQEYSSLMENKVWETTDLPPGKKAIGCKWVFKIKRRPDGSLECYKARVVAKGYTQRPDIDFHETFAPVV